MLNPVLRNSSRLLNRNSFKFCINAAYMDPRRHITMNHNPHNVYTQVYDVGIYPEVIEITSEPSRTYEPKVVNVIVDILNENYKNLNVTPQIIRANAHRSFPKLISRLGGAAANFHTVYPKLLNRLAAEIIVRESRYTWVLEQQLRLEYTTQYYRLSQLSTIENFLNDYNQHIETGVKMSQAGHASNIHQEPSAIQKHYKQLIEDEQQQSANIPDLEDPQHPNFINRLMKFIHS